MNKKEELLAFLNDELFNPILQSTHTSSELKYDFEQLLATISHFSVEGILIYFWTTMTHAEIKMIFSHRLEEEASLDFHSFLDQFRSYFTYEWLRS